jgi:hypothetical protein
MIIRNKKFFATVWKDRLLEDENGGYLNLEFREHKIFDNNLK